MKSKTGRMPPAPARLHALRALGIAATLGLVGACAQGVAWEKPGVDDATAKLDLAFCRHEAERAEVVGSGDLDQPFGSGPGSVPRLTGGAEYDGTADLSAAEAHGILARCMQARGYQPAAPKPKAS
jgi:hypothetical protein